MELLQVLAARPATVDVAEHDHAWRKCKRSGDGADVCYCCDLCGREYLAH